MKKWLIATTLTIALTSHAGVKQEVKFKRGESSAQISGAVIRGERDQYFLGAGKDQYLAVTLTSVESNAVLEIYTPGYKVDADGDVKGTRLSGASEVTRYVGQLPAKGQYLIVVGGTRGNANYELSISITAEAPPNLVAQQPTLAKAPEPASASTVTTPPSVYCVLDGGKGDKIQMSFVFHENYVGRHVIPYKDGSALWLLTQWELGTWSRQSDSVMVSLFAKQNDLSKVREAMSTTAQAARLGRSDPAQSTLLDRSQALEKQIVEEPTILALEKVANFTIAWPEKTRYEGWVDEKGSRYAVSCTPMDQRMFQKYIPALRRHLSRFR